MTDSALPLALILFAALTLRILFLAQFPQVQADEGLWTTSTKNFLLFGDWFMDERSHLFLSPVFHFLSLAPFRLLGPSIEAARLVSALAGTASVLLVYLLAIRLTKDRVVALAAATVMAFDPWAITHSRQAFTESVLLFFIVASAIFILGRRKELVFAGILFALAILTKLNAAAMGIALGGYLLLRTPEDGPPLTAKTLWKGRLADGALFGTVALGLAGLGYWAVAQIDPERFIAVFSRELGGEHVVAAGEASSRVGRVALDPVFAGRNLLEILRLNPFLIPFATLGGVVAWAGAMRGRLFLTLWVAVAVGIPLIQIYQPIRYFFPVVPALAILVGILAAHLRTREMPGFSGQRALAGTIAVVLFFSTAYIGMNFVVNRGSAARVVEQWARENTQPEDPLLLAAYLATNPPNRAYAYDILAGTEDDLVAAVAALGIKYVIWDNAEWPHEMREVLERRYTPVQTWSFGAAYRVEEIDELLPEGSDGS